MKKESGPKDFVRIVVREMEVDIRIGVHDFEKENDRKQTVVVSVALYTDAATYLGDVSIENIIDYSLIIEAVRQWPGRPHTELIETYLAELLQLCFAIPQVEACDVSILKKDICPESQGAGVEVSLTRAAYEKLS